MDATAAGRGKVMGQGVVFSTWKLPDGSASGIGMETISIPTAEEVAEAGGRALHVCPPKVPPTFLGPSLSLSLSLCLCLSLPLSISASILPPPAPAPTHARSRILVWLCSP